MNTPPVIDVPRDKADALERIHRSWLSLEEAIARLEAGEMQVPGPEGWSIKDHLAHLSAWDESVAAMLTGKPRHPALGVDEATYLAGDDAINAVIYEVNKDQPLDGVLSDLQATHRHMLAALQGVDDDDLRRTNSHYQPGEPGVDSGEPMLHRLRGATYGHYDEHRTWIEALAGRR